MKKNCIECGRETEYVPIIVGNVDFGMCICEECKEKRDRDFKERVRAESEREVRRKFNNLVPPIYRITRVSELPCDADIASKVVDWDFNVGRGLILHGDTGKGKTRLMCLLLMRICSAGKNPVVFWAGDAERAVASAFDKKGGYEQLFYSSAHSDVLVFDDLGKDKISERYESFLFQLIEYRTSHLLPTIITTNSIGRTLVSRFADAEKREPFIRRLKEFFDIISV